MKLDCLHFGTEHMHGCDVNIVKNYIKFTYPYFCNKIAQIANSPGLVLFTATVQILVYLDFRMIIIIVNVLFCVLIP